MYTGDFKFDQSAAVEYQTNFGRIADVGEDYVLALLAIQVTQKALSKTSATVK